MKKKLVAVMMCAAMVAMLGVGCGSKSSDDSSSKSGTKKTLTEDDIKDSMKGVKLKVGTTGLFGRLHSQKANWIWELQHFVQQMKEKKL